MQGRIPPQQSLTFRVLALMFSLMLVAFISFNQMTIVVLGQSQNLSTKTEESAKTPYQGRLKENDVAANGTYDFQFTLYTAVKEGNRLTELAKNGIIVKEGEFQVGLELRQTALPGNEGWLEIAVRKSGTSEGYVILTPRQQLKLKASPGEVERDSKTDLSAAATQASSGWTREGTVLRLTNESDNVGIGTSRPIAKLDVVGDIHASGLVKSGNSIIIDGLKHEIRVTDVPSNPAISKKLFFGLEPTSGPFSDITMGIGTTSLASDTKLTIFDPKFPAVMLKSNFGIVQLAVAACASCYSVVAKPGDAVLRADGSATNNQDLILAARNSNGAMRFTTTDTGEKERMTILSNGNIGIGTITPPTLFAIGISNPFQVNTSGDIVRIKNVPYSWPTTQGAANTFLRNDGLGNLTWVSGVGGVSGTCGSAPNIVTRWSASSAVTCSQIFDDLTHVGIGTILPKTRLHVTENITTPNLGAVQVDFTNSTGSSSALGIDVNSPIVTSKRSSTGIRARTSINVPTGSASWAGTAEGRLAEIASFNAFGNVVGVTGISAPSNLVATAPTTPSFAVGGLFRNLPTSPPTFHTLGTIWVGGVYGEIANTFNANPPSGAIAAVIGVDNSNGTANHWAGYFAGKVRVTSLVAGPNQSLCISPAGDLSSCTSDLRLKTNIRQITNVLERVDKIRGVSFNWNESSRTPVNSIEQRSIGVIAQEVETAFPEAVTSSDNDYKAVNYNALTAVLIEAVKELKAENESLKQRIESLEKKVAKQK